MFNIIISDPIYNRVVADNDGSLLHRLRKQQPSRLLYSTDTDYLMLHLDDVLKSSSSLYILDASPARGFRQTNMLLIGNGWKKVWELGID